MPRHTISTRKLARPAHAKRLPGLLAAMVLTACGAGGGDLDVPVTLDALRAEAAAPPGPARSTGEAVAGAVQARPHQLFVDPETRFAFIRLPGYGTTGWKFVGQIDAAALANLPPDTLTSLLPPAPDAPRLASPAVPGGPDAPAWAPGS